MNKENKQQILITVSIILIAIISRLLPHPPNFTPIAALGIFGGTILSNKKLAFLLPIVALFLSDIVFQLFTNTQGFYGVSQLFVYTAFVLITFIATKIKKVSASNIFLTCVGSGIIFFVLSNFGVWLSSGAYYAKTWGGLTQCFVAAIPFYKNEFFGNFALNFFYSTLFYTAFMFGIYAIAQNVFTKKAIA